MNRTATPGTGLPEASNTVAVAVTDARPSQEAVTETDDNDNDERAGSTVCATNVTARVGPVTSSQDGVTW